MKTSKFKKVLSIFLAILMVLSALPVTVLAAEENYGMMEVYSASSMGDYHKYYNAVCSATFLDYIDEAAVAEGESASPQMAWDVSADKDRSVMAWMRVNDEATAAAGATRYDVYIGADGGVKANSDSSYIFGYFSALKEVKGFENFKTENATTFFRMFYNCTSLESVDLSSFDTSSLESIKEMFLSCKMLKNADLSGWNTSNVTNMKGLFQDCFVLENADLSNWDTGNVTDMSYMFRNCQELTELDLSSFNTGKVTTMQYMFYLCKKLDFIYAGDGWTNEAIANLSEGVFNCCYAKFGGQEEYEKNPNPPVSANYVAFEEDGGYLTKAYNVEYEFKGDVPENATAPEKVLYPIGVGETVTVTVENTPAAVEGYTFSGWSTEDADISTGSFEIENDVLIVGTWEKIPEYTVTYVYEGEIPKNAPALPETKSYYEGTNVTVSDEPSYPGYIFKGWTTADADITSGDFDIYNDVEIVGTWEKITATNIEIEIEGSDDNSWIELKPGEETKINVTVKPDDVADKGVTFESNNEDVVKVDEDGNVTAVGEGTAIIKITSKDNEEIFVEVDVKVNYIRYKVTYAYVGDVIPENAPEVPGEEVYIEGSTVTVETAPTADGYAFSGWSTDDVTVENGEFVINNDVHFVGSWEKRYNVYYRYDSRYEVPEGAPSASDLEMLWSSGIAAGEDVWVAGVMPTVEDHIFVGWYTDDVDLAGDSFEMPENDVTLYGYYKKPVESIEFVVNEDIITLDPDETEELEKLQVYVRPDDATIKDIIFESSDESVVKVDKEGVLTPVGEGTATVTVKSADDPTKSDTITVEVKKPVTSITVDKDEITLYVPKTDKVTGTVNSDATNQNVLYESVDPTIAEVDENGNITAKGEGTTTIIVKSEDDEAIFETVTVTVKNPVTDITVEDDTLEVFAEEEVKVEASVNDDATEKGLIYESSDSTIAKVSADGTVLGLKEGTVTITIRSEDNPTVTETVTVTVVLKQYKVTYEFIGDVIPEGVTAPEGATYKEGSTVTVEDNASAEGYIFSGWSTNDAAVTDGKFVINNDVHFVGLWTKLYNVTYEYEGDVPVGAPEVPAKESYAANVSVGVKAVPSLEGYTFTGWYTDDVTVEGNGFTMPEKDVLLKGKWEKLDIPVDNITVNKTEIELEPGKTDKITVTVTPDNATDKSVTYTSSNPGVVKVDENGNLEAVNEGEAIITVTSNDNPSESVTIKVTVKAPEPEQKYYKVIYRYEGEIPANAPAVPVEVIYAEGEEVTVAGAPVVDDYTFSGWSTDDADIAAGKFNIYNDVEIVGKWSKIRYYTVDYVYEGDIPENAPTYTTKFFKTGATVTVVDAPSVEGYSFSGWTTKDVTVADNKFDIYNNVVFVGKWTQLPGPVTKVNVPEDFTMILGEETVLEASVNKNAINKGLTYESLNPEIATVDANGNIKTVAEGTATVRVRSVENPEIYADVVITVTTSTGFNTKHYIVFGKTEKIGWYSVSLDGGKTFFTQFGNDHLEVEKGTEIIVKANDVFGDPFTFYINGEAATPDENGYVHILVDKFILIGALGIPVVAPDAEESLTFFQQLIQKIKEFFARIASWFKF